MYAIISWPKISESLTELKSILGENNEQGTNSGQNNNNNINDGDITTTPPSDSKLPSNKPATPTS